MPHFIQNLGSRNCFWGNLLWELSGNMFPKEREPGWSRSGFPNVPTREVASLLWDWAENWFTEGHTRREE